MEHARLSPSSSARWLSCTASVELSDKYENTSSPAAQWGTNVHYMGELLLRGKFLSVGDVLSEDGQKAFVVDDEMLECATEYFHYVEDIVTDKSVVLIEEQFDLSVISPNQFGTSDATVLTGKHLDVFDLKTGHGIVHAENNTQMMLYALGAVEELGDIYDIHTLTLHIVQTRANHISTWNLGIDELMRFKTMAQSKALEILNGEGKFNPNEKACKWCPHQANCEALKSHVNNTILGAFDALEDLEGQADKIEIEHIQSILDNKDLILGFVKAVEQVALERMEQGENISGYKLVESKTNRKWVDEALVKSHLSKLDDNVDYYNHKLLPMTKILKLRSKDKVLQELVMKPKGSPTIVKTSDKRAPIISVCDSFDKL